MLLIVLAVVAMTWLGVLSIVVSICVMAGRSDRVLLASNAAPSRLSGAPTRRFARSCP
jgi:hypothetical protein